MSNLTLFTRRDPFVAQFDRLVRDAFGPAAFRTAVPRTTAGPAFPGSSVFAPAAEVAADGDDAVVRLELPGLDVERDVTVEVVDGRLVVSGERRDERAEERDGRTIGEVRYGSFRRTFTLPAHVTADHVTASYDAGVLSVRVAGAAAGAQARRIPVTSPQRAAVEPPTGEAQGTAGTAEVAEG